MTRDELEMVGLLADAASYPLEMRIACYLHLKGWTWSDLSESRRLIPSVPSLTRIAVMNYLRDFERDSPGGHLISLSKFGRTE